MPATTPKKVDSAIRAFCRSVRIDGFLTYVDVKPALDAQPHECFNNVQGCIEKEGGSQLFGWAIWSWPGVFVEAENHSIWRKADGTTCDPTPTPQGETSILFLEDDSALYDFTTGKRRDNVRAALRQDMAISAYLNASAELHAYLEDHSAGGLIQAPRQELISLGLRNHRMLVALRRRYLGPNDLCTCGSGRKVKKCCGIEAAIDAMPKQGLYKPPV